MREIAAITLTRDRNAHLANLVMGLDRSTRPPDALVVARMGGEDPRPALAGSRIPVEVIDVPGDELPLGAARNRAVRSADADLVVSLDVDCVPTTELVRSFESALGARDGLAVGPVHHLPQGAVAGGEAEMRAAASISPERASLFAPGGPSGGAHEQFWSTCFAVRSETFERIGGFDEGYRGYGIEDTDFGMRAREAGVEMVWVPGAVAFHQWHPPTRLDASQLGSLVRNARRFHDRWGTWPAADWLAALEEEGKVRWIPGEGVLEAV